MTGKDFIQKSIYGLVITTLLVTFATFTGLNQSIIAGILTGSVVPVGVKTSGGFGQQLKLISQDDKLDQHKS